jgi:DNA-binding response OmpR family regulator
MAETKKVLIIEDEKVLGEVLMTKLRREGFDTNWEMDGEAGLAAMRKNKPDLILLDIVMPKKDGYEVLQEMRSDEALKDIPVIVISNSGQPVEVEKIMKLGVKDYIIKAQFTPEEVLKKMSKYIGGAKIDSTPASDSAKKKVSILVVEDDQFLSSLATSQLTKAGYTVSAAFDGEWGLKAVQEKRPDLVLLDIIMPVMNGFEMLKKMKADPNLKDIAVIIFSNLGQQQEIDEGKQLGADDFLIKAKFTLREVMEKIEALLKKRGKL